MGFGLFGKPGFGRQTKTFYSIEYNTRMETRWTLFKPLMALFGKKDLPFFFSPKLLLPNQAM